MRQQTRRDQITEAVLSNVRALSRRSAHRMARICERTFPSRSGMSRPTAMRGRWLRPFVMTLSLRDFRSAR